MTKLELICILERLLSDFFFGGLGREGVSLQISENHLFNVLVILVDIVFNLTEK